MAKKKNTRQAKPVFPIWGWVGIAVLAVVVIWLIVSQLAKPTAGAYPDEVTVSQAAQKRDQGDFILDVREPSEWQELHIPGATLIPLGELPNRLNEVPKDRGVVVVCRSGNRSAKGRDILREAGFPRVTSMAGGMNQWQSQGLPTASGQ